jgi:hypothetical protein
LGRLRSEARKADGVSSNATATDATVANAAHVASRHQPGGNRDATNAHHRASGCKYMLTSLNVSRKSQELTDNPFPVSFYPCAGQRPATPTNIVLDGWTTHPRPGGLFRISFRSHIIKSGFSLYAFFSISSLPFHGVEPPLLSFRTLAQKQLYNSWGHAMCTFNQSNILINHGNQVEYSERASHLPEVTATVHIIWPHDVRCFSSPDRSQWDRG